MWKLSKFTILLPRGQLDYKIGKRLVCLCLKIKKCLVNPGLIVQKLICSNNTAGVICYMPFSYQILSKKRNEVTFNVILVIPDNIKTLKRSSLLFNIIETHGPGDFYLF